jgi:hypothetical protein
MRIRRASEWVTVAMSRRKVEMPWASRQALLDRFRHLDSMRDTRAAFEAEGTSAPVRLSQQHKADLLRVIEFWGGSLGSRCIRQSFAVVNSAMTGAAAPSFHRIDSRK